MGLVDGMVHRAAQAVRTGVRKMVLPGLLALAAALSGAAGIGFLTVWAFLALSAAMGPGPAALLLGLGHVLLSVGLVLLVRRLLSNPARHDRATEPPAAHAAAAGDELTQLAFAAAFVLARYLGDKGRNGKGS